VTLHDLGRAPDQRHQTRATPPHEQLAKASYGRTTAQREAPGLNKSLHVLGRAAGDAGHAASWLARLVRAESASPTPMGRIVLVLARLPVVNRYLSATLADNSTGLITNESAS
jgi:hypothetical protein